MDENRFIILPKRSSALYYRFYSDSKIDEKEKSLLQSKNNKMKM